MMAKQQTFQTALDRLEEIVTALEKNEVALEDAIHLFEEGLSLVNHCDKQLKGFEESIAQLMHEFETGEQDA